MSLRSEIIRVLREYLVDNGKKITALPSGSNPAGGEYIEAVQGGQNVKFTISQIALGGSTIAWGGFISSPPSLPLAADTQYVAEADFDFGGTEIFTGSILFGPAGAASVDDFIIKP